MIFCLSVKFFLHFPGKIGTSCPEKGVGDNTSLIRRLKSPIQLQITCMFRRRIMIPFGPGYIKQNCVLQKKIYQKLVFKKPKTFLFAFINQDYILK